jgi:tetratricopeptide (TPR) repeat protein
VFLSASAHAEPVGPETPDRRAIARQHEDRARDLFNDGRYLDAARQTELAYDNDPRPSLLYAAAQSYRLAGDCPAAISLYEKFLASAPPSKQRVLTEEHLATCRARVEPVDEAAPATGPRPTTVEAPAHGEAAPPDEGEHARIGGSNARPNSRLKAAQVSLFSLGAVAVTGGIAMIAVSQTWRQRVEDGETLGRFRDRREQAVALAIAGPIVASAGVAFLAGAIVVTVKLARSRSKQIAVVPGLASVSIRGRF